MCLSSISIVALERRKTGGKKQRKKNKMKHWQSLFTWKMANKKQSGFASWCKQCVLREKTIQAGGFTLSPAAIYKHIHAQMNANTSVSTYNTQLIVHQGISSPQSPVYVVRFTNCCRHYNCYKIIYINRFKGTVTQQFKCTQWLWKSSKWRLTKFKNHGITYHVHVYCTPKWEISSGKVNIL